MKILFFDPEQYVTFENEPSNYELRLPIINCGLVTSYKDFVYQRVLRSEGRKAMNEQALRLTFDFEPDLVVYSTTWDGFFMNGRIYQSIDSRTLKQITGQGIPVYIHAWDTYYIKQRPKELEWFLNCTYFGVAESVTNYIRYRSLLPYSKAKGVIFTPGHNVFTDIIHKKHLEKIYDVTLLGSNEGQRVQLIQYLKEKLANRGISFHKLGGLVDSTKTAPSEGLRLTDKWIPWGDYVNIINQSKICLCSQTILERCQVKGKIFDILACGTLCISDLNSEVKTVVPDDCIVYYENLEDCFNKIVYFLKHEDERMRIAERGYQWFHATFDYKRFWAEFLRAAINGDMHLPTLPCLETKYDQFQRSNHTRFSVSTKLGINPLKIRLSWETLKTNYSGPLRFLVWKTLKTIEKLIGPVMYGRIKKIWYSLMDRKKTIV